jgi:peptide/nickel transport system substrate-binding protein
MTMADSPRPVTRRELLNRAGKGLFGVSLGGLAAACSAPEPPQAAVSTETVRPRVAAIAATTLPVPTSPPEVPHSGGILRFGTIGDFANLEGQTTLPNTLDNLWSVWDRLSFYDDARRPQPMLAESWEVSADQTQIKLNLRKGVQFHSGRELTAEDVSWSLRRVQDPKVGGAVLYGAAKVIVGIEVIDRNTLVLKASRPWSDAFDLFEIANIIDPVTFQSDGLNKPAGTGPFAFAEYVQGDYLRLTKNKNYWRSERPYLDEVLVSIRRDAPAAVTQLEAGTLDLLGFGLPVVDAVRLQKDPSYSVVLNPKAGTFWTLLANCTLAPTNNKLVRQALSYALDRSRIAANVWHGLAKTECLPWSPTSPAYDPGKALAYSFDLDKARSLLAASGETHLNLELVWPTSVPDFATVGQIYQADLSRIGVSLTLKPLEPPAFVPVLLNKSYQGLTFILGAFGQFAPAMALEAILYSPESNDAGFKDDTYRALVDRVLTATDPDSQTTLYRELNDYLLDQSWVLPITQSPSKIAARANVRGLRYDQHDALVLSDVWLA